MTLRDFINELRTTGKMQDIPEKVSPVHEASAIAKKNQKPLFFHDVMGWQVAMNVLGSRELLASALRIPAAGISMRLAGIDIDDGTVKTVDNSPTEDVKEKPDLQKLPVLTHFPDDRGPYITAGVVVSEYDGVMNASVHRMMVIGKDRLAVRLVEGRHTYNLHRKAAENGEHLPVAIAIGMNPAVLFAACTRVPESKEFQYASAITERPVELFECSNGVKVPHSEIVLEGYVHKSETVDEGPFVDITGTYDLIRKQPVIKITGILHRHDPVYHGLLPAGMEHKMLMGVPYEPLIYKEVSKVTDCRNVLLTEGGCCYFHAVVQIRKEKASDGKAAIDATFNAHKSSKHAIIVDEDIDIFDINDVEFAVATRVKGDKDIYIFPGVRGSTLDPRSENGIGTKVGIDATVDLTKKWKFERVKVMGE